MNKMTVDQLFGAFYKHNRENNITSQFEDKNRLVGVIVFKASNWPNKDLTEEERSYRVVSDNKFFINGMGGNSIYGDCLDGVDRGVRLDWYMYGLGRKNWKVDYCYLLEDKKED